MALKRNETYPGRFNNPTSDHPQGAFKNRSAPGAQDGSYLEQQWANDWDGFFGRLLTLAGITPDGNVDTASTSQYYDALKSLFLQRANPFGDIKADGTVNTALSNLGLGNAALKSVGTGPGQLPDMSSFAALISNSGYQRLPGGLILQWGTSPRITTSVSIIYPIPFPNARLSITANPVSSQGGAATTAVFSPGSKSSCSMTAWGTNNYTATWIAIGY